MSLVFKLDSRLTTRFHVFFSSAAEHFCRKCLNHSQSQPSSWQIFCFFILMLKLISNYGARILPGPSFMLVFFKSFVWLGWAESGLRQNHHCHFQLTLPQLSSEEGVGGCDSVKMFPLWRAVWVRWRTLSPLTPAPIRSRRLWLSSTHHQTFDWLTWWSLVSPPLLTPSLLSSFPFLPSTDVKTICWRPLNSDSKNLSPVEHDLHHGPERSFSQIHVFFFYLISFFHSCSDFY